MSADCVLREFFQKSKCCFANVHLSSRERKVSGICEVRLFKLSNSQVLNFADLANLSE